MMKPFPKSPRLRARRTAPFGIIALSLAAVALVAAVILRRLQPPNPEEEAWNSPDGVTVSILGDSISTFEGYVPTGDGVNLSHESFYPRRSVRRVENTWWVQVIDGLDARLGVNESWSGSRVLNTMEGNQGNLGEDAAMASMTRIRNLGSNGTPDIILFFGGTNDISFGSPKGEFDPAQAPTVAELTATRWETFAEAYTAAILRMQCLYPDAKIYAISPTENAAYYDAARREEYVAVMKDICACYGVPFVDLTEAGFTTELLFDGTHPGAEGMKRIADTVLGVCRP